MLQDGDRGVVLQRDRQTYAIAPHLPCGLVTPQALRRIADVAEHFGAKLKCTGAQRIAIIGLREEDVDAAWTMLGETPAYMSGNCIRSIQVCPGKSFCKRGLQETLEIGLELDRLHYGRKLPGKMKIGIAGCANQCTDAAVRDIGLVGGVRGWTVLVGGKGGMSAQVGRELTEAEVSTEQAMAIVDRLIDYFAANASPDERMADMIHRVGMPALRKAVLD
jgi:NAD(P)H-nitrite reductase large subunit